MEVPPISVVHWLKPEPKYEIFKSSLLSQHEPADMEAGLDAADVYVSWVSKDAVKWIGKVEATYQNRQTAEKMYGVLCNTVTGSRTRSLKKAANDETEKENRESNTKKSRKEKQNKTKQ